MIAVGIAIGIFGYAMVYAGVKDIQGVPTGIIESLRPGYKPGKPPADAGGFKLPVVGSVPGLAVDIGKAVVTPLGIPKLVHKKVPGI